MREVITDVELDALADLFIEHRVLIRKSVTFNQFVSLCRQGKMKELID